MSSAEVGSSISMAPSRRMNWDQRLQFKTIHNAGLKHKVIACELGLTLRQVGYARSASNISPKRAKGRKPALSNKQADETERFVYSSLVNGQIKYLELAMGPFQSFGGKGVYDSQRSEEKKLHEMRGSM